jgi:N-glycosylase/DNA lyase
LIGHIGGQAYHDFPQPERLIDPSVETHLRQLGFGYRAKYLWQTAVMVHEKGIEWLEGLRNPESPALGQSPRPAGEILEGGRDGYRRAHEALLELQGVGPKVADCICLMGLGWGEAVPVDTHGKRPNYVPSLERLLSFCPVWQIAQRDYKFGKGKHSSLTKATYDAVGNRFRALWGKEAGWAHSVLFTADLRAFSERLVEKTETSISEDKVTVEKEGLAEIQSTTTITTSRKRVKVEDQNSERKEIIAEEDKFSRIKRRRR